MKRESNGFGDYTDKTLAKNKRERKRSLGQTNVMHRHIHRATHAIAFLTDLLALVVSFYDRVK